MATREEHVRRLARLLVAAAERSRTAGSDRERDDWREFARALTRTIELLEREPA